MVAPILSVKNLTTRFHTKKGPVTAVDRISYDLYPGETLGIVGESGCGKSVTSFSIMGLIDHPGEVQGDAVLFNGKNLLAMSEKEFADLRGSDLAMIFQEPMTALNPVLTIGHQIDETILRHRPGTTPEQARTRSIEMLQIVGIPSAEVRYNSYPHQLSGGMRQRAMIAMALACEPKVLIADEPTTALDVTIQAQILELIQNLQEKLHMTVQFITHDLGVISEISDRVMVMYGGTVCEIAPTLELFKNPLHPYTKALIDSRPKLGHRVGRLNTIEGSVPALTELPKGCPFQNRCAKASALCLEQRPEPKEKKPGHFVSCFHPNEEANP